MMPTNEMDGGIMPFGEDAPAIPEFPDGTGTKNKPNRLVITGGPLGPQLMMIPGSELYPEEEDPNP